MAAGANPVKSLSKEQCALLAVHFASEADIAALRQLLSLRPDAFDFEFLLRCLLTYLPETTAPSSYTALVDAIAHGKQLETNESDSIDTASVQSLSVSKARKRVKTLHLLPLSHSAYCPESEFPEPLVRFLVYRAHLIDQQTGLLDLLPPLITPFLNQYPSLRTWFLSNVLPLHRLENEFTAGSDRTHTLEEVEVASDERGVEIWLSGALHRSDGRKINGEDIARDLRSLVGPWMYGSSARKRKRADHDSADSKRRRSSLSLQLGLSASEDSRPEGWDVPYYKLVETAKDNFPAVSETFSQWNGPLDVDLEEYDEPALSSEEETKTTNRFVQAAYSSIYHADGTDKRTISAAYNVLGKIASLSNAKPLPGLQTQLADLHQLQARSDMFKGIESVRSDIDSLMQEKNPLTKNSPQSLNFARFCIISAHVLDHLGHPISISGAAKTRNMLTMEEQASMFGRLVHSLVNGQKPPRMEWALIRLHLLWLWGWGSESSDTGLGMFGKVNKVSLEKDFLEALLSTSSELFVDDVFISDFCRLLRRGQYIPWKGPHPSVVIHGYRASDYINCSSIL
jgi:hypothetical protein